MNWMLLPVGFLAGVCASMGIGGGFVLMLYLTLFAGLAQKDAQLFNLLFFLPAAASALLCHRKNGYLDRSTLRSAIPPAAAFALLGAWIATAVDADVLRRPFGIYLLLAGVSLLWPQEKRKA